MPEPATVSQRDVAILRRLAQRKLEAAHERANLERRDLWYRLDEGGGGRPMVLAEFGGVRDANRPLPDTVLACEGDWARGVERGLRAELYRVETLRDDHVVEPWLTLNWRVRTSDYGVQAVQHHAEFEGTLGARRWDPPIRDLDADFGKLHPRGATVDRQATLDAKERLENVFGGILPVRIRGGYWWTLGMTWPAIDLIGLESLMLWMFDHPEWLHRLMAFLRDDHLAYARWLEAEGLLNLNNRNDYIGSGSMGYTRSLPQPDWRDGDPVRTRDQWVLLESQETVGVGPEQFEEFIFPYQLSVAEAFGRVYYGCCEPVHSRIAVVKRLPRLARVSVSPWADETVMAAELGADAVYSRKPSPSLISTERFDEAAIRADVRQTLDIARGCRIELVMKDVHTLNNEPERLPRWVALARDEIDATA